MIAGPTVVTGAFGYVGGRLCKALVHSGRAVRVQTRRPGRVAPAWAADLEVVVADLLDPPALDRLVAGASAVVHCAAMNEINCARDPARALRDNGIATVNLLEAAMRARIPRFLYVSTAFVYGSPPMGRLAEDGLARPMTAYGITHRVAEDFVLAAHNRGAVEGVVVRLANSVGAPADASVDRWTLLANDLCRQAVTTHALVLRGHGLDQRDFVPMSDVVGGLVHLLDLPRDMLGDGLFNLGSGRSLSVFELANLIAGCCESVLGFRPPVRRVEPGPDERGTTLDYRIDRLLASGFALTGDLAREIVATLRLCAEAFVPSQP